MVGERIDPLELALNRLGEDEGIEAIAERGQARHHGAWLQAFQEAGVERILGFDGAYVSGLQIPREHFRPVDLETAFEIPGAFDLAVSLEVVEHLSPSAGAHVVRQLTRAAPAVLFSAAIPGQRGRHHINLQWPRYWAEQFAAQGFVALDVVRPRIWLDARVVWWYRQNVWVYACPDVLERHPHLKPHVVPVEEVGVGWVHEHAVPKSPQNLAAIGVRRLLRAVPQAMLRALRRRVGRRPLPERD